MMQYPLYQDALSGGLICLGKQVRPLAGLRPVARLRGGAGHDPSAARAHGAPPGPGKFGARGEAYARGGRAAAPHPFADPGAGRGGDSG